MHHPTHLLAGAVCLLTATSLHAQIVVASDNFETTDHPTGDRTVVSGGINGIRFYTRNATGAGYSPSIVSDTGTGGLGSNALNSNDTTSAAAVANSLIGVLPQAISLTKAGDFVQLSFRFRYLNNATASSSSSAFRFGLENSNGTIGNADGQTSVTDDDQGYYVQTGVKSAPSTTSTLFKENGGTYPILGGADREFISTNMSGANVTDNSPHNVSFTITRGTGSNLSLAIIYDGGTPITATTTSSPFYAFNEIAFSDGIAVTPVTFNVDDISVTTSVPEPCAATVLAVGSTLSGILIRPRKPPTVLG